ncbi:hypothetical protein B0A48_11131 [Cryoendolithus antarcticus]|uniref:SMP-30/Gluconolactonase/LRE-like region domain-containing protein n=1 Tax=Cryoendolithus antarcticus TaxID=1507870 RepID=A0A1V8SV23_9PEZI|nr:hypothetical protein B0A48_11131 [Cryoendolithus antarcticus]
MSITSLLTLAAFGRLVLGQSQPPGVSLPVAKTCGPTTANIVCIDRYGSVLPYHFFRESSVNETSFGQTSVPNDTSFGLVGEADFLVFDEKRALRALGSAPTYDFIFNVSAAVHEAPVWVPTLNKLFISQLAPPPGYLPQLVVDLNQDPPTLSEYLSDPPVYAPNGGTFYNGLIYWGASGGNNSIGGTEQRSGIRTLDPLTNKTVTLLNNYYGYYFNTVDDLAVDSAGAVWFTDPNYSWYNRLTDTAPQLKPASYRFDPKTGAVTMIDDSIAQPNGIALSPNGAHLYISDTGAVAGLNQQDSPPGSPFNQTGPRAIYKFDIVDRGTHIANKRPVWYAQDWVPDGLKDRLDPVFLTAANGWVLTGAGKGVDVLDEYGVLIMRVQTSYVVQNFAWVGNELTEFWMMGNNGISRVRWALQGQDLAAI